MGTRKAPPSLRDGASIVRCLSGSSAPPQKEEQPKSESVPAAAVAQEYVAHGFSPPVVMPSSAALEPTLARTTVKAAKYGVRRVAESIDHGLSATVARPIRRPI